MAKNKDTIPDDLFEAIDAVLDYFEIRDDQTDEDADHDEAPGVMVHTGDGPEYGILDFEAADRLYRLKRVLNSYQQ